MNYEKQIENVLDRLSKSTFRNKFHLKEKDIIYVKEKGLDTIESHTLDFIEKRLASKEILNDGKQTPMKGHPTFVAQHATATCCRGCIEKWHRIPKGKELTSCEKDYIKEVIMTYIKNDINMNK